MHYDFRDNKNNVIAEHENKIELIRSVCQYYKGKAIDDENVEYDVVGVINIINEHGDITSSEQFYEYGVIRGREQSPYLQSEFI